MKHSKYDCSTGCPVEATLDIIGGKWKGVILFLLMDGPRRFSELQRLLRKVTQRALTNQLREMEADGLITRTVHPEIPPRVDYALTDRGRSLHCVLLAMRDWGREHVLAERAGRDTTPAASG